MDLYINNIKADIDYDAINILMNYEFADLQNPTVIKTPHSKTVKLFATAINDDIFQKAYKLDRKIVNSFDFNPNVRVKYALVENSQIYESGFLKVDNITTDENGISVYNITLYSDINDFFLNLSYTNENSGENVIKSLSDLQWGWNTETNDKSDTLFTLDAHFVKDGWDLLKQTYDSTNTDVQNDIVFVPTYGGKIGGDFSNDKCLVNVDSIDSSLTTYFPTQLTDGGQTYSLNDGYAITSVEGRDNIDMFEVGDFRSHYLQPAVRMKKFLEVVSDKDNNGGYTVNFSPLFKKTHYFEDSWMLLDRISFEGENLNATQSLNYNTPTVAPDNNVSIVTTETFDTSTYTTPEAVLNIIPQFIVNDCQQSVDELFMGVVPQLGSFQYRVGVIELYLRVFDGNQLFSRSVPYVLTTNLLKWTYNRRKKKYEFVKQTLDEAETESGIEIKNLILNKLQLNYAEFVEKDIYRVGASSIFQGIEPLTVNLSLPQSSNVSIEISTEYHFYNIPVISTTPTITDVTMSGVVFVKEPLTPISTLYPREKQFVNAQLLQKSGTVNGYYDDAKTVNQIVHNVSKQLLFNNKHTALDYLLSFTKMFGLKWCLNPLSKTIDVKLLCEYFDDKVIDFSENIDYSKEQKTTISLMDKKYYKFECEEVEAYANKLYNMKNPYHYGSKVFDSGYQFNFDEQNLYDGNVYTNLVDYTMSNQYFNIEYASPLDMYKNSVIPPHCLSSVYKYNLWNSNNELKEFELNGVMFSKPLYNVVDQTGLKICCFNDSMENVSITASLVFFNGFAKTPKPFRISDTSQKMLDINDGKEMWLYSQTDTDKNGNDICININEFPRFNRFVNTNSLVGNYVRASFDFGKPNMTFIPKTTVYNDSRTIYNQYWEKYINDLYDVDGKKYECYCQLDDIPQNLMNKFFWFENCLWVLNKVSNFNIEKPRDTVLCEFIKVKTKNNYLQCRTIYTKIDDIS